ncbi:bcl-2-like protein 15 isoform X1 [Conger conger]|uniref:bcl-2-like protein 15 isoform X1 n=1 Tax=Conger conger TaxID=82655 RepID=UPI002A59E28C|nr:bcl-2-like protein 15 isoform X1 [Conger conger]
MAPKHIENQTRCIISCLFHEGDAHDRGMVVPDGDVGDGVQELREPQPLPKWQSPALASAAKSFPKIQIGEPILVTPASYAREDPFDPVLIADKLRELGDDYDEKVIQPLINNVRQAAADQVVQAFGDSVDGLCRSWVGQGTEVVSEMQLLKASVTLGLYVKNRCPDLVSTVQNAMGAFVNTRLGNWVEQQGGWDEVASN